MRILDTIEDNGHRWAVIDTGRGEVTFTLNEDGTIYALSPDGGALQESESAFMDDASDAERDELRGLECERRVLATQNQDGTKMRYAIVYGAFGHSPYEVDGLYESIEAARAAYDETKRIHYMDGILGGAAIVECTDLEESPGSTVEIIVEDDDLDAGRGGSA